MVQARLRHARRLGELRGRAKTLSAIAFSRCRGTPRFHCCSLKRSVLSRNSHWRACACASVEWRLRQGACPLPKPLATPVLLRPTKAAMYTGSAGGAA